MNNIYFTPEQLQQIINTIVELPAKHCFDVLLMIKTASETQQVKTPTTNDGTN